MSFWIYLLVMAGITYLIRMLPLVLFKKKIKSRFVLSFLYYVPYVFHNITAYGIGVIVGIFLLSILDKQKYETKLFLGITFAALRWITSGITTVIYALVSRGVFNIPLAYGNEQVQFTLFVIVSIIDSAISFLLLNSAINFLRIIYKNYNENITIKEMLLLSAPSIMAMSTYFTVVSRVTVHITSDSAPIINCSLTAEIPPLPSRMDFITYRGEVPISP